MPDYHKLEFELQIQPQHPWVQDDRGRPTGTTGDKRFYRSGEGLGFVQNRACVDDVEDLHFGNDGVPFVNTKNLTGAEIELRELRCEAGARGD